MDIHSLLEKMSEYNASDLYITVGMSPSWRSISFKSDSDTPLTRADVETLIAQMTSEEERKTFYEAKELNIAVKDRNDFRYRANFFYQQQNPGIVIRKMRESIPPIADLSLPKDYLEAIMEQRGLVLVVGMSGSGKSTSIASMIDHRNNNGQGHIITIEDPIEYVHKPKGCIFTQREIGIDTNSWEDALKNALRQRPDVIYIGEIRDAEAMAHAINFAETGHLCIATLHATSASQAVERVVNFFPAGMKDQYLYALSHVLKFIFAQRLVRAKAGQSKIPAIEILRNVGLVKPLILQGKIAEIRDLMGKNSDIGMMNFENSLMHLLEKDIIDEETAIGESDNPDNMRLNIMKSKVRKSAKYGENSF